MKTSRNLIFMFTRIAVIPLVLFSFTFGASLLVPVNTVEANDNVVHWFPYTRYYYCDTGVWGVVHTETGEYKKSYYIDSMNPNEYHYETVMIISPITGGHIYELEHVDHPVTYYTYPIETVEHIYLDRSHWRCR